MKLYKYNKNSIILIPALCAKLAKKKQKILEIYYLCINVKNQVKVYFNLS